MWSHTHISILHKVLAIVLEYRVSRNAGRDSEVILGRFGLFNPCAVLFTFGLSMTVPGLVMAQMANVAFDATLTRSILRHQPSRALSAGCEGAKW